VGLLDEELFAYVEDVDWSVRVCRAGLEVVLVPQARAWHDVGGSTGGEYGSMHTLYYGVRNTIVVCERHRPLGRLGTLARRVLVLASYLALVPPRRPWRRSAGAVLEGFAAALAGRMGPRP
jgi:GT2 family glycosyltransferase